MVITLLTPYSLLLTKYTSTKIAAAEVTKNVSLLPKATQIQPAIMLASKVQTLWQEV